MYSTIFGMNDKLMEKLNYFIKESAIPKSTYFEIGKLNLMRLVNFNLPKLRLVTLIYDPKPA